MKTSQNLSDAYDPMAGTLGSYARGGAFQDEPFPPRGELEHRVPIGPNVPGPVPAQAAWAAPAQFLYLHNDQKVALEILKDGVFQDDAWVREISARRARRVGRVARGGCDPAGHRAAANPLWRRGAGAQGMNDIAMTIMAFFYGELVCLNTGGCFDANAQAFGSASCQVTVGLNQLDALLESQQYAEAQLFLDLRFNFRDDADRQDIRKLIDQERHVGRHGRVICDDLLMMKFSDFITNARYCFALLSSYCAAFRQLFFSIVQCVQPGTCGATYTNGMQHTFKGFRRSFFLVFRYCNCHRGDRRRHRRDRSGPTNRGSVGQKLTCIN